MAQHDQAVAEVPAGVAETHAPNPMSLDATMMILTWITFLVVAAVLYRVAWKPILAGLDKREATIRKALEDAAKAQQELERINQQRQQQIDEADAKAKAIVQQARQAAVEAANAIEGKAREESQILLANAQRELKTAHAKALAELRRESADLAIDLSRKIIGESLDEKKSRELVDRLIHRV